MEFDKNRLMDNINILIKDKSLKIGELEVKVGVSVGYLSRLGKSENETVPNIDFIWKLSHELGVSIDALLNYDFSKSNDNLLYLCSFIQRLIKDTDCHEIEWKRETVGYYSKVMNGSVKHPLFIKRSNSEDEATTAESIIHKYVYDSKFLLGENVTIMGDGFRGYADGLGTLYLMDVFHTTDEGVEDFWELYLVEETFNSPDMNDVDYMVTPICYTIGKSEELLPMMQNLYKCIKRHDEDIQLSNDVKSKLNRYLNFDPNSELPFN